MLLWLIAGVYRGYTTGAPQGWPLPWASDFVLFLLFFLLGWTVFGFPIKG